MGTLPTGTVTFLFTDIEGSTHLWEQHPEAMRMALARHDHLLRQVIERHGGHVFKTVGDAFCATFGEAPAALAAAVAVQRALRNEAWDSAIGALRVRVALHSGTAEVRDADYFGPAVNRVARLVAAGHGGQILLTLAMESLVRDPLPADVRLRDLGEHRLRDLVRPERVFQVEADDLPSGFPELDSLSAHPNNLPLQLTSFIGRERELAEVKALLQAHRLVTLTGAGGTGKTRLSVQVAAALIERHPDGIWLVELAPLGDPALLVPAMTTALRIREAAGQPPLETLLAELRRKRLLLLLDNCEHLIAAAAQLVEQLLRRCQHVQILASSREALGLAGEGIYHVPSLALPALDRTPSAKHDPAAALAESEAGRLFVDRAAAVNPRFHVTPANASAIAQICHRLDGIPLALELAAARIKVFSAEQIAARLDDRFRLLTGGSRTALPRQQTLHAAIAWSYDLLPAAERALLRRLSVFAGGFGYEAVEAACAGGGAPEEVLDLLTRLIDKSLVEAEERTAETRYRLLETVRQFARERLAEAGEVALAQQQHAAHFLALAEAAEPELVGPAQHAWLDRLDLEHDNLRAALAWSLESGDVETAERIGSAIVRFWLVRRKWSEGRQYLEAALAVGDRAVTRLQIRTRNAAGLLAYRQDDAGATRRHYAAALAGARELGDLTGTATALWGLARLARFLGDTEQAATNLSTSLGMFETLGDRVGVASCRFEQGLTHQNQAAYALAVDHYEAALALLRSLAHHSGIAEALFQLGRVHIEQGEYERATAWLEESRTLAQELGDDRQVDYCDAHLRLLDLRLGRFAVARSKCEAPLARARARGDTYNIGWGLNNLGDIARCEGADAEAAACYAEALPLFRQIDDTASTAVALHNLGYSAQHAGDSAGAASRFGESLRLFRQLGDRRGTVDCIMGLAGVVGEAGQPERAARLFGAAEARLQELGATLWPSNVADYERNLARLRHQLDEAMLVGAWTVGRAWSLEQAVAEAVAVVAELTASS